jgi:hypothetical protein
MQTVATTRTNGLRPEQIRSIVVYNNIHEGVCYVDSIWLNYIANAEPDNCTAIFRIREKNVIDSKFLESLHNQIIGTL